MNSEADTAMSQEFIPARQNHILAHCEWTPDGLVRVKCTQQTEPLLRFAGVHNPRPCEVYLVGVKREPIHRFLVVDHDIKPQSESLGNIFGSLPPEKPAPSKDDYAGFFDEVKVALCKRSFEFLRGPQSKIRIEVIAFDDESLPSPLENEAWNPRVPSDGEIREAITSLHIARDTKPFEITLPVS